MMEPEWRYHDRSDRCPVSPLHKVERERYLGGVVLCKAKDAYWPNTLRYRDWTAFEQQQASAGEVPENVPVEYPDQAYAEGVRDLATMIRKGKSANWLAVAAVLDDCAAMIERLARGVTVKGGE